MTEVNNLTAERISPVFLKKIAKIILKGEKREKFDLSIVLVGEAKIAKLNKKYRNKNRPTDVLSFSYRTLRSGARWKIRQGLIAHDDSGEIMICPAVVRKNARRYGSEFKKELTWVSIHGILHLLGYGHKTMAKKQNYYLNELWRSPQL